ncbi:hypothetical protein ACWD00_07730 [Streptomyces viridiviolaceus]
MGRTAGQLLETTTRQLAPDPGANRLVPLPARGAAGRDTLAALALEQRWVIAADHRSFLHLADRAAQEPRTAAWSTAPAEGGAPAGRRLEAFAAACGVHGERAAACEPLPGCQAHPAYVA